MIQKSIFYYNNQILPKFLTKPELPKPPTNFNSTSKSRITDKKNQVIENKNNEKSLV